MLEIKADELIALCLEDHEKVSFPQLKRIRDSLMEKLEIGMIDISGDGLRLAVNYYPGSFEIRTGETDSEGKTLPGHIQRKNPEHFQGDYHEYEFFSDVRGREICTGEVLRVIDSCYREM